MCRKTIFQTRAGHGLERPLHAPRAYRRRTLQFLLTRYIRGTSGSHRTATQELGGGLEPHRRRWQAAEPAELTMPCMVMGANEGGTRENQRVPVRRQLS